MTVTLRTTWAANALPSSASKANPAAASVGTSPFATSAWRRVRFLHAVEPACPGKLPPRREPEIDESDVLQSGLAGYYAGDGDRGRPGPAGAEAECLPEILFDNRQNQRRPTRCCGGSPLPEKAWLHAYIS